MEALIHNLNTMNSRAGAQVPFSSINYGMDTSPEGRMVMRNVLLATEAGLGNGETPIFPIQIFRVKEGVSYNPGDPNYDLFKLAMPRSAPSACSPTSPSWTRPSTCSITRKAIPRPKSPTWAAAPASSATSTIPTREICPGRGNLSFTSINLPRIAIKAKGDIGWFFEELERMMRPGASTSCWSALRSVANKKVYNFPFLMGEGVWLDSEKLGWTDAVREVLKHGTLSIGFIGLAEALKALRRQAPRRGSRQPEPGPGDRGLHPQILRRVQPAGEAELHLSGHPRRGSERPLCPHRQGKVWHHPRRDRSGILHQLLPCAGVLSHQRL